MSAPVLDRDHLEQYTAGDTALEAELFGLLSSQMEACISAMKAAIVTNGAKTRRMMRDL